MDARQARRGMRLLTVAVAIFAAGGGSAHPAGRQNVERLARPDLGAFRLSATVHDRAVHGAIGCDNAPWAALDYGRKYWASYAGVCQRVQQGSASPGDEATNYLVNPGEAFADTYRELIAQRAGDDSSWAEPTGVLPFLTPSFPNDQGAYDAVLRDVTNPWTGPSLSTWSGVVQRKIVAKRVRKQQMVKGKRHTKWVTVRVPACSPIPATRQIVTLDDGAFEAHIVSSPPGATLSLFDSSGTVPIGPTGVTDVSFTVCGQRSVTLILGAPTGGSFDVSLSVA